MYLTPLCYYWIKYDMFHLVMYNVTGVCLYYTHFILSNVSIYMMNCKSGDYLQTGCQQPDLEKVMA